MIPCVQFPPNALIMLRFAAPGQRFFNHKMKLVSYQ